MKMLRFILIAMAISCSIVHAQGLVNGDFSGYSCDRDWVVYNDANYLFYNDEACGLTPWKISHGTPDLNWISGDNPAAYCAGITAIQNSTEGLFQDYTMYKGNRYYLRAYVSGHSGESGGTVDRVYIAATNGLTARHVQNPQASDFVSPNPPKQEIWYETGFRSGWKLIEQDFFANDNYSQVWFNILDGGGEPPYILGGIFFFTDVYLSCCALLKSYDNTSSLPSVTNAGTIEAGNNVVVSSGQNVAFKAENRVILSPGFLAESGAMFSAKTGQPCDCSMNGGNVFDVCAVFPGNISYIANASGTGVYVPNVINRDVEDYWYPTSFGYSKPYNANYWKLKILNRWDEVVYEKEGSTGVDGFANKSIRWDGGTVSTGVYYVNLELRNCSGSFVYNGSIQVFGSPNARVATSVEKMAAKSLIVNPASSLKVPSRVSPGQLEGATGGGASLASIFPNPVKDVLHFNYTVTRKGALTVALRDIYGQTEETIYKSGYSEGTVSIDYNVRHLKSGIYFCTFQEGGLQTVVKIVKD